MGLASPKGEADPIIEARGKIWLHRGGMFRLEISGENSAGGLPFGMAVASDGERCIMRTFSAGVFEYARVDLSRLLSDQRLEVTTGDESAQLTARQDAKAAAFQTIEAHLAPSQSTNIGSVTMCNFLLPLANRSELVLDENTGPFGVRVWMGNKDGVPYTVTIGFDNGPALLDLEISAMETPDALPDTLFTIQIPENVELKDKTRVGERTIGCLPVK